MTQKKQSLQFLSGQRAAVCTSSDQEFKKEVYFPVTDEPICIVHYVGNEQLSIPAPHGNSAKETKMFFRTLPSVKEEAFQRSEKDKAHIVYKEMVVEIQRLINTKENELVMHIMDCHQQTNGNDCGLFAIANAITLCLGLNPCDFNYKVREMRGHLIKCLENKELKMFPVHGRRQLRKKNRC